MKKRLITLTILCTLSSCAITPRPTPTGDGKTPIPLETASTRVIWREIGAGIAKGLFKVLFDFWVSKE